MPRSVFLARSHTQKSSVWNVFCPHLCAPKVAFIPVLWCKTESVTAQRKVSITTFLWIHVHSPLFLHLPSTNWKTQKFQFLHLTFEYLQKMRDLNVGIVFSPVHKNPMQPEEEKCSSSNWIKNHIFKGHCTW